MRQLGPWRVMLTAVLTSVVYWSAVCRADSGVACRERQRLLGTDIQDKYELTEATLGSTYQLACHYCNEQDDQAPKQWYVEERLQFDDVPQEVTLGMSQDPSDNHLLLDLSHGLVIQNVTPEDAGIYFCHGIYSDEYSKYNYLLDVVIKPKETFIAQSQSDMDQFTPLVSSLNALFSSSPLADFTRLRSRYGILLQVLTVWGRPGPCDPCAGNSRRSSGRCKLQPAVYNETVMHELGIQEDPAARAMYLASFELSCYSVELKEYFPQVFDMLQKIPQFSLVETCIPPYGEVCVPDSNVSQRREPYYRNHYLLPEGSDLYLTCPESSTDSRIVWRRDGVPINPASTGSTHIVINSFSSLFLLDGSGFETSGNYTCYVNGVRMQETIVRFISGDSVKQAMYRRHVFYLLYIFLLSFIFYCGGLIRAYTRRRTFRQISWDVPTGEDSGEDLRRLEVVVEEE